MYISSGSIWRHELSELFLERGRPLLRYYKDGSDFEWSNAEIHYVLSRLHIKTSVIFSHVQQFYLIYRDVLVD